MLADYFLTLARYNAWANRRLYSACADLTSDEYYRVRPAFFGSIHATLNHILLTDRNWFGRIDGSDPRLSPLNRILHDRFEHLRAAREAEDQRIIDMIRSLNEQKLTSDLDYRNTAGQDFVTPLGLVVGHIFNHQTHHRAQVHDMLSQTAVPPPPLDLLHFVRGTFDPPGR